MHTIFCISALWLIAGISGIIQYAKINKSVVLVCQQAEGATNLRWRRNDIILTDGHEINTNERIHKAFKIDFDKDASQYNLRIANVTVHDFGVYLCEMQINNGQLSHQVTLSNEGKQIIISGLCLFHFLLMNFQCKRLIIQRSTLMDHTQG